MKPVADYKLRTTQSWRGLRTKHDTVRQAIESAKSAAIIIVCLLGLLAVHGWMVERDLADAERQSALDAKQSQAKAEMMVAHLMNGRAVIDTNSGDVFFFQVSTQRGL